MRTWLLRLQFGLMRMLGIRRLSETLGAQSHAVRDDLGALIQELRAELAERERSTVQRFGELAELLGRVQTDLSALRAEEGGRGRSATERGDTLDLNIRDLRAVLGEVAARRHEAPAVGGPPEAVERSIGDLRVEVSSMRVDFAREMEYVSNKIGAIAGSLNDTFAQALGDLRVEMSSMRADIAREIEFVSNGIGTASGSFTETFAHALGDLRVEVSSMRADIAREMEFVSGGVGTASSSLTGTFADALGDLRVEVSGMRADIAREIETMYGSPNLVAG